jgi:membrane associated rhomboid family serine protease
MNLIDEIRTSFIRAEGLFRLLFLNILIFIIVGIFKVILFLAGSGNYYLMMAIDKLAVKSSMTSLIQQPWSLLTYMFVHENFMHILFNMLILYWTGKIFCEFLGSRKIVVTYILGGIIGAVFYIVSYNIFPVFSSTLELSKLIGASAGVIAVLVAIATLVPDYTIHLMLFGPVRLKFIAIFLVLIYLISIPDGNAGGNISHLGGAVFGFTYTTFLKKGIDIGLWLDNLIGQIMKLFQPSSRIKIVHKKSFNEGGKTSYPNAPRQEQIDSILDKISRSGYSSLSKEEKETLFKASKNQGKE